MYIYLLFDADDTLFDFVAAERLAFAQTMQQYGLDDSDERLALYRDINEALWRRIETGEITGVDMQRLRFAQFLDALGLSGDGDAMNAAYVHNLGGAAVLFDGAAELIADCAKKYTLAIVTNGLPSVQRRRFDASGLSEHIEFLFISGEVGHAKPSPLFFDHVCRKMGIENRADALIIGDSLSSDIRGGRGSGIDTCWYNQHRGEHDGAAPTYVVEDYDGLRQLLGV